MPAVTRVLRPRQFLLLAGTVLVITGLAGATGLLGSISRASVFNPPYWINWVHLAFGILVLAVSFAGGRTLQNAFTLAAAILGTTDDSERMVLRQEPQDFIRGQNHVEAAPGAKYKAALGRAKVSGLTSLGCRLTGSRATNGKYGSKLADPGEEKAPMSNTLRLATSDTHAGQRHRQRRRLHALLALAELERAQVLALGRVRRAAEERRGS